MLDVLRGEGLTDVEVVGVYTNGRSWSDHNPYFDEVRFPMLLDPEGAIFYLYNTTSYDMIFIDRQLRLVAKGSFDAFDKLYMDIPTVRQRLRELDAE